MWTLLIVTNVLNGITYSIGSILSNWRILYTGNKLLRFPHLGYIFQEYTNKEHTKKKLTNKYIKIRLALYFAYILFSVQCFDVPISSVVCLQTIHCYLYQMFTPPFIVS